MSYLDKTVTQEAFDYSLHYAEQLSPTEKILTTIKRGGVDVGIMSFRQIPKEDAEVIVSRMTEEDFHENITSWVASIECDELRPLVEKTVAEFEDIVNSSTPIVRRYFSTSCTKIPQGMAVCVDHGVVCTVNNSYFEVCYKLPIMHLSKDRQRRALKMYEISTRPPDTNRS